MKKFLASVLALVLVLSMVSAMAEDAFIIGTIGPTTGPYAQYGGCVENSAMLAAEEINALGGVQFTVYGMDDQGDGEEGIKAKNQLLMRGMKILLGCVTSGSCMAVAAEANEQRLFMLTPSASADMVNQSGDQIFQVCFTDTNQGSSSAQWLAANKPDAKIGIVYNNAQDYSMGITVSFKNEAAALGLNIVAEATFLDDNNADFSAQIAAMKDAGADLVFIPIYYTPAIALMAQGRSAGYEATYFGVDGMDGILGVEGLDESLVEGLYMLTPFDATATDERTVNYVTKYSEKYGTIPNQFGADAYDGMYILKALIEATGVTPDMSYQEICEVMVDAIVKLEIDGLTGHMTWNADGTVTKIPSAVMIENGVYVTAK